MRPESMSSGGLEAGHRCSLLTPRLKSTHWGMDGKHTDRFWKTVQGCTVTVRRLLGKDPDPRRPQNWLHKPWLASCFPPRD